TEARERAPHERKKLDERLGGEAREPLVERRPHAIVMEQQQRAPSQEPLGPPRRLCGLERRREGETREAFELRGVDDLLLHQETARASAYETVNRVAIDDLPQERAPLL